MRARIIEAIREKPSNTRQLALYLKVDYKTIQHHLKILLENRVLVVVNKDRYGALYFPSPELEENIAVFEEIWKQFGKSKLKR